MGLLCILFIAFDGSSAHFGALFERFEVLLDRVRILATDVNRLNLGWHAEPWDQD